MPVLTGRNPVSRFLTPVITAVIPGDVPWRPCSGAVIPGYAFWRSWSRAVIPGYAFWRPCSRAWTRLLWTTFKQPFIGNDDTTAHQKSDIQQEWTSYKWVPMQNSTMCWDLKPMTCNRKLSDTRWSGKRWCKQCDGIQILLKRSWVDLEIRSSTVMIRSIYPLWIELSTHT